MSEKMELNQLKQELGQLDSPVTSSSVKNLSEHYERSYETESLTSLREWRALGALDKTNNIIKLASKYPHANILEIGAGEGAILSRLDALQFGEQFYALEISESAVRAIRERGISRLVESHIFDGQQIPYQSNFFDLVILSHVVEHAEHPRTLLYEAARVGRYLFVEVPLEYTWRLPESFQWTSTGHINHFSPKLIRYLLQSSHLSIQTEMVSNPSQALYRYHYGRVRGFLHFTLKQAALALAPFLANQLFAYHYSALCKNSVSES